MDTPNYIFIFAALFTLVYGELRIIDLKVPSTIESGSNNEVILDCDFEVKDEQGLEVKWFYDKGGEQIYQWIPNASKPQSMGLLKDRVDLNYKASNDSNTMYRALRIRDVTPDLSGYYTCKVTSFYSEDTATKRMIIYEPAKEFELLLIEDEEDASLTAVCSASGIFPKPNIDIYVPGLKTNGNSTEADDDNKDNNSVYGGSEDANSKEDGDVEEVDNIEQNDDSMFNATSTKYYKTEDLDGPIEVACRIWIPGTTYQEERTKVFYPENMGLTIVPSWSLLASLLLIIPYFA